MSTEGTLPADNTNTNTLQPADNTLPTNIKIPSKTNNMLNLNNTSAKNVSILPTVSIRDIKRRISPSESLIGSFAKLSNITIKMKKKATAAKARIAKSPTGALASRYTHQPTEPVKYTERPERTYRRLPIKSDTSDNLQDIQLAKYGRRPEFGRYPEFDGKIQLPPVTLSNTSFYISPEERYKPIQFLEPSQDRLCTEGVLYCQDTPEGLYYPLYGLCDITVPIFFCFATSQKHSYIHVRDIRGHSSKIVGWRDVASEDEGHLRFFCFEMKSQLNLGTGNELLTFGTSDRDVAYKWLNYIRRASHHHSDNKKLTDIHMMAERCPIPPPPTRRNREMWPSFTDVAMTKVSIRDDDRSTQKNEVGETRRTEGSEKFRTVQNILLDLGLVMDEQWAGGPATVYTIEDRAAQHLQTWYRAERDHFFVHGPHGLRQQIWAALCMQKSLRGWRIRKRLERTKTSARIIQRHWRKHRMARNLMKAKQDMDRKLVRAKAYFLDSARMKVIRIWRRMADTSLRVKDICRRALNGVVQHSFDRWYDYTEFRLAVKREKLKQDQKEKHRRAKFFIKKMVYRHAATAIHSWKALVEQNKRARAMLKRHMTGQLETHFVAWFEYVQRLNCARRLCKRVLLGVEKNRLDDWLHFIRGRLAARTIQTCWRRFTAYRNFVILVRWKQYAERCAYCIQSCWRVHVAWQTTWGSGGVFVKMMAARLIQAHWRGYSKRQDYNIYLHKIRLLQGRFRFWFHHRRAAAVFVQYQWRRYWSWKVAAVHAVTMIQSQIRAYFVRMDRAYRREDVSYSYQYDGVVLRGVVQISDRYGAYHRVLCTARHEAGTLRYVFVDPRSCTRALLFFRTMQLVKLAEERWSVRRHLRDVESLAQVVLDLVIVLDPGSPDPEYILRPKLTAVHSSAIGTLAFPLRSPRAVTMHDILIKQNTFWDSVFESTAQRKENRLPIGLAAQQLILNTDKAKALRDTVLAINQYCGEEDVGERVHIAVALTSMSLRRLLAGKQLNNIEESEDDFEDEDTTEENVPSLVLAHSFVMAQLLIGLHHAPVDIFDRVEHRAAEILVEHNKKATNALSEYAENRGMRPVTADANVASSSQLARWDAGSTVTQWEILLEDAISEMHYCLDTTQQMETPFVRLRETFENAVAEQEHFRRTSCSLLQLGADNLFDYLANAGAVNSTTDMMIRARISTFIEQCADKIELLNNCRHIQVLHQAVAQFKSLEQMRSELLDRAYEMEDKLSPEIETLAAHRRAFVSAYFSKQRVEIRTTELTLLETARRLHLFMLPELRKVINNCVNAAEDLKSVLFELGPALEESKECAYMYREDIEAWYAHESISIVGDRDALAAEIEAKRQARLKADLEEAERGGKSIEQVKRHRLETGSANRIQRVYRAYLERGNRVNAGGVWTELVYNSKILIHCLDMLVAIMEESDDASYELAMIQSLQMRVHKLSEQAVMRNLGPCMKHAHVVEKRWPLVDGLMEKWAEEERMAALKADDPMAQYSSEEDSASDWDSEDEGSDISEEESDDDDSDSEDEDGEGNGREKAKNAVIRAKVLPQDIHSKLRVLWRAHLSKQASERERQAAIRAAQFGPRMRRKMLAGAKYIGVSISNSTPVKVVGRQLQKASNAIKERLRTIDTYQTVKLSLALFGYNHFPQYFSIPEGVKEKAAMKIQKRVRGMLARMLATRIAEERDERVFDLMLNNAAVKIQTLFRYYAARKYTLELVRISYNKEFDDKAGRWCYHNTVADTYTYKKPPILGEMLDLPTPRSKARGMKWSADYYVEKQKKMAVVHRKLVLTNTVMRVCNHPACSKMEEKPDTFVQCPRCKVKFYCGRPHQLNHLDQHGPECEEVVRKNREKRAKKRAAKKMGVDEGDLMTEIDSRTDEQRKKDKQTELFRLEKMIDELKKGIITQEEYTFALRTLTDL